MTMHEQLVKRIGLGRAISLLVDEALRRGTEPASALGALVDVAVSYAHHHARDVEVEIVEPARKFAAELRVEAAEPL